MDDLTLMEAMLHNTITAYRDAARCYAEIREAQSSPPPAPAPVPPAPVPGPGNRLEMMEPAEFYAELQANPQAFMAQLAQADQEAA